MLKSSWGGVRAETTQRISGVGAFAARPRNAKTFTATRAAGILSMEGFAIVLLGLCVHCEAI